MNGMEQKQVLQTAARRNEATISGWELFCMRPGERLRLFYLQSGLALLVFVTAGIFAAAAWFAPQLYGSSFGARRADAVVLVCGVPAIALAAVYVVFLRPRAVLDAYAYYARRCFSAPQRPLKAAEDEERAFTRRLGVYGLSASLRLLTGAVFGAAGYALLRWLGARFGQEGWSFTVVWTLCTVLFWQGRMPLAFAQVIAARERCFCAGALRCGWRQSCRARSVAVNAAFRTMLVVTLPLLGVLALSAWISAGDTLVLFSIAAFLLALLDPPQRLLLAALDTAAYAEIAPARWTVKRLVGRAKRLRMRHDGSKGQEE